MLFFPQTPSLAMIKSSELTVVAGILLFNMCDEIEEKMLKTLDFFKGFQIIVAEKERFELSRRVNDLHP